MKATNIVMLPSKLEFKPVANTFSLKGHIYETLREGIASMNIYADDAQLKLDERQLSEQLGISRTPIRERSEEHTSELQSLMRISYAVSCLKKKKTVTTTNH